MRLLTFNLWHGLSPTGLVAFEALEPSGRRRLREELQIETLRHLKPDFCFFQEVNPAAVRVPEFAKALGMQGLYQPDLVGLKLFGVGLPLNLNSGLVILAARQYGLKWVEAVSLSRPGSKLVQTWGSWQLKEERFALLCETMWPRVGRVLLVDTHLHHGLELTHEFSEGLERLGTELELSASLMSELKTRLQKGNQRRAQELSVLLRAIERHQKRYAAIVIAGDFNASPESELSQHLREAGFVDAWAACHGHEQPGFSFDHTQNSANHLLQSHFPLTLVLEDLSFSPNIKESLLKLAREQENRPRRIDYLWVKGPTGAFRVKSAQLVGRPNQEGLAPSDHFGVLAELEV